MLLGIIGSILALVIQVITVAALTTVASFTGAFWAGPIHAMAPLVAHGIT